MVYQQTTTSKKLSKNLIISYIGSQCVCLTFLSVGHVNSRNNCTNRKRLYSFLPSPPPPPPPPTARSLLSFLLSGSSHLCFAAIFLFDRLNPIYKLSYIVDTMQIYLDYYFKQTLIAKLAYFSQSDFLSLHKRI